MPIDIGDIPTGTPPTAGEKLQIRSAIGVGTTDAPTFLAQTLTGQSLTGVQATSLVDLSATWNTSGTPTAIKLNVVETGINSNAASKLMDLQVGGVSKANILKNGVIYASAQITSPVGFTVSSTLDSSNQTASLSVQSLTLPSGAAIGFTNVTSGYGVLDTMLFRDPITGGGILAQRNGLIPQAFRVYNAYYGTTADEWGAFDFKTNVGTLTIGTQRLSTGGIRNVSIVATGATIQMAPGGTNTWKFDGTTGNFLANSDNAFDIGAVGANRPKNIYAAGGILGGTLQSSTWCLVGSTSAYYFLSRGGMEAPSDGVIRFINQANNGFTRLELGTANLGISRGTGSPEGVVTALIGSLYLRTDGGVLSTLYVKESGTGNTGWAAK